MVEEKEVKKVEKAPEIKEESKVEAPKAEEKKVEAKEEKAPAKKESTPAAKKTPAKAPAKEKKEKVELEREYVVPLRAGFIKAPRYRKAKKAVKTLQEFLAKHMRVENRDIRLVKVDRHLNNEIWHRGIKNPIPKVHVKAKKIDGVVYAELATIPEARQHKINKEAKKYKKVDKKALEKVVAQEAAEEKIKEGRSESQDKEAEKVAQKVDAKATKKAASATAEKHTAKAPNAKMDKMAQTTERKALKK
jgi:large subunit ribosomal protein L31e